MRPHRSLFWSIQRQNLLAPLLDLDDGGGTYQKQNFFLELGAQSGIPIFRREQSPSSNPMFTVTQNPSRTRLDY